MTARRHVPTALAVTALAAGLLAALAPAAPAAPSAGAAAGPSASRADLGRLATASVPRPGQCYRYSVQQAAASSSPTSPVACSAPHTAWTYHVGTFTGRAARVATPTSLLLDRPAMAACYAKRAAVFGASVDLTRIRFAWFVPTPAQWARGARFFRCDAVAEVGASSYEPLPPRLPSVVASAAGLERFRACARSARAVRVPCSLSHDVKAVATVRLGSTSSPFPGSTRIGPSTEKACAAALSALPGAPALAWYTWPVASSWAAGHKVGTCYAADPPAPTG